MDDKPEPDARVARSQRVLREAALAELAAHGWGGFTIESVAARAGAGKSTVYRLWGSKAALVADAVATLGVPTVPGADAPDARDRVEALVRHVAEILADSVFSACLPGLVDGAARDPALRDGFHGDNDRRRQLLVDVLAAGVDAGELPADLDPEVTALALVGPLFYRRLLTAEPFPPGRVGELCEQVLGPRPTGPAIRPATDTR